VVSGWPVITSRWASTRSSTVASTTGEISARQLVLGGIEHTQHAAVTGHERLDPVGQGPGGVLSLQQHNADTVLDELQRAVEEVGRVHRAGADPLHLLQDAHAVIEGLRPRRSGPGDDVVRPGRDRFRQLPGPILRGPLDPHQQGRQLPQLAERLVVAAELTALPHDRQGDDQ
jgi:hypothetical protein